MKRIILSGLLLSAAFVAVSAEPDSASKSATTWGRISYGPRAAMEGTAWIDIPVTSYVPMGTGSLAGLNGKDTDWQMAYLRQSQLRFDGWFYVDSEKAGSWTITQTFDDYFAFSIDGTTIFYNNTYRNELAVENVSVSEGWHRFTVVCGDTWGGCGSMTVAVGDIIVPFSVTVNGTTYAFSEEAFPQGTKLERLRLEEDADWSDLESYVLESGTVLDLNGHNLTVNDILSENYVGAYVTNTADSVAVISFTGPPLESTAYTSGIVKGLDVGIVLANAGDQVVTWTGAAGDGDPENADNWACQGVPTLPTSACVVKIIGSNVDLQCPTGTDIPCKAFEIGSCTFAADCDWAGLFATPVITGTANLDGHVLTLNRLAAKSGASFAGGDGSTVRFNIADGTSTSNLGEASYIDDIANLALSGSATIKLAGSGAVASAGMKLGDAHRAAFVQNGGTVALSGKSGIGSLTEGNSGIGVYRMNGGNLTTDANSEFHVGWFGQGEFIQTAGNVTIGNWLGLGRYAGSTGTCTINGGTFSSTKQHLWVACENGSTGTLNVTGSGVATFDSLNLCVRDKSDQKAYLNVGESGKLVLQGYIRTSHACRSGVAAITQSGGEIIVGDDVNLGEGGGEARFVQSAGTLTVAKSIYVADGRLTTSTAMMDVGGTVTANGGVFIGFRATGNGALYVREGGVLNTVAVSGLADSVSEGTSCLTLDGGTLRVVQSTGPFISEIDQFVVTSRGATIDTAGCDVSVVNCGIEAQVGSSLVKTGEGVLAFDALPPVDTLAVSQGKIALSSGDWNAASAPADLKHRWSFTDGSLRDSVGNVSATPLPATGAALTFENNAVAMTGDGHGTGALDLGTGLVDSSDVTIEIWATRTGVTYWSRIFDFGSDGRDSLTMTWVSRLDGDGDCVQLCVGGERFSQMDTMAYEDNVKYHIVMTIRETDDGSSVIAWERRDSSGQVVKSGTMTQADWTIISLSDKRFLLGRSQSAADADANAIYDEVRIWRGALSAESLALSAVYGPDATDGQIAEIASATTRTFKKRTLDVAEGAGVALGGFTLTQPVVRGAGTVSGGTLVVTDTFKVFVGDCLKVVDGTIDLSNAELDIANIGNLTKAFTLVDATDGGTIVGVPGCDVLPNGWRLSVSGGKMRIVKRGLFVLFR